VTTPGTLSLRGLGRLLGVSDRAVRKALMAGVFSDAAVRRDDAGVPVVLNATVAVAEWEKSGRQLRGSDRRSVQTSASAPPAASPVSGRVDEHSRAEIAGDVPEEEPVAPGAATSPTLVQAQTEAALQRGRQLRMENDLQAGLLVEADTAASEAFEFARTLRENILNIPARLAAELAAESDAGIVHRRLEDALREALESTARTLDAAPPGDGRGELVAV